MGGNSCIPHIHILTLVLRLSFSSTRSIKVNKVKNMKKFTLMFALVAALTLGVKINASAQATRHAVIVEIGTGTWCQYCPGAALGADDLHASASRVGIVEHHDSDPYETAEARMPSCAKR